MKKPVLSSENPVTLIGGGIVGPGDLDAALARAPLLVAADGGAGAALAAGHDPMAVIGDMDSLDAADRARIPDARLFPIAEQDSTDFDKAMHHVTAPLLLAVGFLGGRLDHQLAALNTLVRFADQPCIILGETEVIFHAPKVLDLPLAAGDIVSLFPLMRSSGRSHGLKWPIDGLVFDPGGQIGTSNQATGPVRIELDAPGVLIILPRSALDLAMRAIAPDSISPGVGTAQRPARG